MVVAHLVRAGVVRHRVRSHGMFDTPTSLRFALEVGPIVRTPPFQAFFADYEAEQRRLRDIY